MDGHCSWKSLEGAVEIAVCSTAFERASQQSQLLVSYWLLTTDYWLLTATSRQA